MNNDTAHPTQTPANYTFTGANLTTALATETIGWTADVKRYSILVRELADVKKCNDKVEAELKDADTESKSKQRAELVDRWNYSQNHMVLLRAEIRKIENSLLTVEPATVQEASMFLRFISQALEYGDKIDKAYLADIIESCVSVLAPKPEASQRLTLV